MSMKNLLGSTPSAASREAIEKAQCTIHNVQSFSINRVFARFATLRVIASCRRQRGNLSVAGLDIVPYSAALQLIVSFPADEIGEGICPLLVWHLCRIKRMRPMTRGTDCHG